MKYYNLVGLITHMKRNWTSSLWLGGLPPTTSGASLHPPETHRMVSLYKKTCHRHDRKFKENWLQVCQKCKIITLNCHKNWSGLATPSHLERVLVLFVRREWLLRRTTIKPPLKWHVRLAALSRSYSISHILWPGRIREREPKGYFLVPVDDEWPNCVRGDQSFQINRSGQPCKNLKSQVHYVVLHLKFHLRGI